MNSLLAMWMADGQTATLRQVGHRIQLQLRGMVGSLNLEDRPLVKIDPVDPAWQFDRCNDRAKVFVTSSMFRNSSAAATDNGGFGTSRER
jgi:hypothetical protein